MVDEAFERACMIATKLSAATDVSLRSVADRLRMVSGVDSKTGRPLAVARLRGGVLHDDGWARLPSQPAVITSTVDQLGSRLLFRGYGHSARTASIFAGLAAHDSVILLDEAHLSVPFMQTLRAVRRFRGESWAEEPIRTPFAFAMLSATPPADVDRDKVFPGTQRKVALDHPELHRRTRASKPAELVELKAKPSDRTDVLVLESVARVRELIEKQGRQRTAVVVNRVATAQNIADELRDVLNEQADVVLFTGRLRPLERDELVALWQPQLKAHQPQTPGKPVVLVATQCIEVGADFSFDAMVTEAASLDALRQRFGRLNRLGETASAPAAVLIRSEDAKAGSDDPVYGTAMAECWQLLKQLAEEHREEAVKKQIVDFGIAAMDAKLAEVEDWSQCIAPTADAPLLLPSHLDLLAQTSPIPHVQPDISLYLHGAGRGEPEVHVVWRADLKDGQPDEVWKETVALCPPNSLETLSVPLSRLRRWLKHYDSVDETADVEGAGRAGADKEAGGIPGPVLIWRGRDDSEIARRISQLKPNDLVVVPAAYGMTGLGQSDPREVLGRDALDIWEPSHARSGKAPALRLQRDVLTRWLDCPPMNDLVTLVESTDWDEYSLLVAIDAVLDYAPPVHDDFDTPPDWWLKQLKNLRHGRKEQHPAVGVVLFGRANGRRRSRNQEQDLFADDDDLLSAAGCDVPLDVHSALVERATGELAERCLPERFHTTLKTAAYWHDTGKLDERFQVWLRQGDELAAVDSEPLAKSKEITTSPSRRRWLRDASGLPERFRHEMLSLQLAEQSMPSCGDTSMDELALHCVASHHGYGRPFAPVSLDPNPSPVVGRHDGADIKFDVETRADWPVPHSLASGIAERFWRLNRRYGWWGLGYLEGILRLGDWYGSRLTQDEAPLRLEHAREARRQSSSQTNFSSLLLAGIDGANPLGLLAAVGALVVLHQAGYRETKLAWQRHVAWQPVLSGFTTDSQQILGEVIAENLRGAAVSDTAETERQQAEKQLADAKKRIKEKRKRIKQLGLRGNERRRVLEAELAPLERQRDQANRTFLGTLRKAVPKLEMALGTNIDCDAHEFRNLAHPLLDSADCDTRESLDMLAAFASDARLHSSPSKKKDGKLAPTPFAFISGGGHQDFLGTARQLLSLITPEKVVSTLFESWRYIDEGLSMRWDPTEDRRYALMDRDPTASDNKARTVWMANLLAYRALAMFPSAPRGSGLVVTGWSGKKGSEFFTWPLWDCPATPDVIRSLFLLPELYEEKPNRPALQARNVRAVFRARRIKVGEGANYKINFSPSHQL